jgi:hypothetical protein
MYLVVEVGVAVMIGFVAELRPVFGDHEYEDAPEALKFTVAPGGICE